MLAGDGARTTKLVSESRIDLVPPGLDLDHQPGRGAGGLLFGYDWVVIGGAKPFYEKYLPPGRPRAGRLGDEQRPDRLPGRGGPLRGAEPTGSGGSAC